MIPTNGSSTNLIQLAANVPAEHRTMLLDAALRESTREAQIACTDCALGLASDRRVPWDGPESPLFLLGSAPNASDAHAGQPFTGILRSVLSECMNAAGLKLSQVATGYTIGCRPPGDDYTEAVNADAVQRCRRHVLSALTASKSWLVVLLGAEALRWAEPTADSLSGHRGRVWWNAGLLFIATFSPAEALHSSSHAERLTSDLHVAAQILEAEKRTPPVTVWEQSSADKLMPPADRESMRLHYNKRGWVVLNAKLINAQIAIVRDERVQVPVPWDDLPRYTLAEINKLIPDPEYFRIVNMVKSEMPAEVLT